MEKALMNGETRLISNFGTHGASLGLLKTESGGMVKRDELSLQNALDFENGIMA
jgi:hypothetical protein